MISNGPFDSDGPGEADAARAELTDRMGLVAGCRAVSAAPPTTTTDVFLSLLFTHPPPTPPTISPLVNKGERLQRGEGERGEWLG